MKNQKKLGFSSIAVPIVIALALIFAVFVLNGFEILSTTGTNEAERYALINGQLEDVKRISRNEHGLTYGSAAWGSPNLVRVEATNGIVGYVFATELDAPEINSHEESLTYMEELRALNEQGIFTRTIPVFKSDGTTVIGEFEIGIDVIGAGGIYTLCGERVDVEIVDGYHIHSTESGRILGIAITCSDVPGVGCCYDECCYEYLIPDSDEAFVSEDGEVIGNIINGEFVSEGATH
ncbi:MAG: hypothetical protein FWF76_03085 [Oscillospiraceae bacterium]|nr:hypothetical protein [Oscillospiraceae bacterium]